MKQEAYHKVKARCVDGMEFVAPFIPSFLTCALQVAWARIKDHLHLQRARYSEEFPRGLGPRLGSRLVFVRLAQDHLLKVFVNVDVVVVVVDDDVVVVVVFAVVIVMLRLLRILKVKALIFHVS